MGKTLNLFRKFWADNIMTNYKKISIALGTTINIIIGAVLSYYIDMAYESVNPRLGMMIIIILIAVQGMCNIFVFAFFGKATNGNGFNIPETKLIIDVIRSNEDLRLLVKERINTRINNDSSILNGD